MGGIRRGADQHRLPRLLPAARPAQLGGLGAGRARALARPPGRPGAARPPARRRGRGRDGAAGHRGRARAPARGPARGPRATRRGGPRLHHVHLAHGGALEGRHGAEPDSARRQRRALGPPALDHRCRRRLLNVSDLPRHRPQGRHLDGLLGGGVGRAPQRAQRARLLGRRPRFGRGLVRLPGRADPRALRAGARGRLPRPQRPRRLRRRRAARHHRRLRAPLRPAAGRGLRRHGAWTRHRQFARAAPAGNDGPAAAARSTRSRSTTSRITAARRA